MADRNAMWIEKYRPKTLEEYVFHDERMKATFEKVVQEKSIPGHLLLSGVQGTGKTTLALILINELGLDETDVLSLNASDENNVEVMREKVKGFISTFAMGDFKIVHLEEADFISHGGQLVLRRMMEEYADNARFILTCNYENKILPELKSRVQTYRFKAPDRDAVTEFAATVLISEKVKFDIELLDKYVSAAYPDIRKIVGMLQQNSINGQLLPVQSGKEVGDYKFDLLDLLEKGKWNDARKVACENVAAEEWEDVYRFLYENLHKSSSFASKDKWEAGIVIIADHLYKHSICSDSEINFAACMIRLGQV